MTTRRYSDTTGMLERSPLLRGKRPPPITRVITEPEYGGSSSLPTTYDLLNIHSSRKDGVGSLSSHDDFGDDSRLQFISGQHHKNIKSGRQRKKIAARTKGGEFQARRKKRRLYFCCLGNEIDVEGLADKFVTPLLGLRGQMYDEVLHLHSADYRPTTDLAIPMKSERRGGLETTPPLSKAREVSPPDYASYLESVTYGGNGAHDDSQRNDGDHSLFKDGFSERVIDSPYFDIGSNGKEVFVFDFGAVVFWGLSREEANDLLIVLRKYVQKGRLSQAEFEAGEDDMAFVTAYEAENITISNDVILLPEQGTSVQSRLAVSFAIAQSAVLSIFEDRIEQKIEEYRFIPQELARSGEVELTPQQLGLMIGEVFVIRHDVNLHSEILDIPDYFWKANYIEPLYRMTSMYLEMEPRTDILNKRLDLLQELLRMVQHQHENAHGVKLEWIVIWLIMVSIVLEMYISLGEYFRWPV